MAPQGTMCLLLLLLVMFAGVALHRVDAWCWLQQR